MEAHINRNLSRLAVAFLSLLAACSMPFGDGAVPDDGQPVETYEVGLPEDEENGSITVHVVDTLDYVTAKINCDNVLTVYLPFYQHYPDMLSKGEAGSDVECDYWGEGVGPGITITTTATIPVSYSVYAEFTPRPRCELKLQVNILYRFSEVKVVHHSLLGDIPFEMDDYFYSAPVYIFLLPGQTQSIIAGMFTLTITPDDYVIPAWTGCLYQ